MRTIILPGFSPHNKEWADETAKKVPNSSPHYWAHWQGGSFSPQKEVEKIIEEIGKDKVNILAKSVGTAITNSLLIRIPKQLNKIILCGIPSMAREGYKDFANFDGKKIICFQNTADPWAKYEEVKEFLGKINPQIKVIPKEASTHDYPYYQDFSDFLSQLEV